MKALFIIQFVFWLCAACSASNKSGDDSEDGANGVAALGGGGGSQVAVCMQDGQVGCITTDTFKSVDTTALDSKVVLGETVAGVAGTVVPAPAACSADGQENCLANADFRAAKAANFSDADIRDGVTIAGVEGVLACAPSGCASDGETGCLANSNFPAVDKVNTLQGNVAKIRDSLNIAGVDGTLADCGSDGAGSCFVDGTTYKALNPASVDAAKMLTTQTLLGVTGAIADRGSWNLTTGFPGAGRFTGVSNAPVQGDIRDSVQILGVTGNYTGAGGTLDPWDLRAGVDGTGITVGDVAGKLKVNCRNMVDTSTWDNTGSRAGAGRDVYDTIDDYNNGSAAGGSNTPPFPTNNPWLDEKNLCGFNDPVDKTWERLTTTPATANDLSVYKDKITNLNWTRGTGTATKEWDEVIGGAGNGALEYCEDLDLENAGAGYGGITGWRLPTQKELMAAYEHGIHDLDDGHTATNNLGDLDTYFWSSSTLSSDSSAAWYTRLNRGTTDNNGTKADPCSVICVSMSP